MDVSYDVMGTTVLPSVLMIVVGKNNNGLSFSPASTNLTLVKVLVISHLESTDSVYAPP
jgi:hypothetical protein